MPRLPAVVECEILRHLIEQAEDCVARHHAENTLSKTALAMMEDVLALMHDERRQILETLTCVPLEGRRGA